jgi:hypothetical protein
MIPARSIHELDYRRQGVRSEIVQFVRKGGVLIELDHEPFRISGVID